MTIDVLNSHQPHPQGVTVWNYWGQERCNLPFHFHLTWSWHVLNYSPLNMQGFQVILNPGQQFNGDVESKRPSEFDKPIFSYRKEQVPKEVMSSESFCKKAWGWLQSSISLPSNLILVCSQPQSIPICKDSRWHQTLGKKLMELTNFSLNSHCLHNRQYP